MSDEQVQPTDDGEVQEPESKGMTEEQVNALLEKRERTWQSRFDKLLKEKKETETTKKTVEEQMSELKQELRQERLEKARSNALHATGLESSLVDAMRDFLGEDSEGIESGASRLHEYIQSQIDAGVKAGVDAEVEKRFKGSPKPAAGAAGGEMTEQDFLQLTEEQLQGLGTKKVAELTRKFAGS